jgi:hypothetical protein
VQMNAAGEHAAQLPVDGQAADAAALVEIIRKAEHAYMVTLEVRLRTRSVGEPGSTSRRALRGSPPLLHNNAAVHASRYTRTTDRM